MSEKRFLNIISVNGGIEDTVTGEIIKGSRIGDLLNQLNDENEQLKKQIAKDFNQSNCITVQKSKIMDLEKENEQLKSDRLNWITNQQELECLTEENTNLKLLLDFAEDLIISYLRKDQIEHWENMKKNLKGDVE